MNLVREIKWKSAIGDLVIIVVGILIAVQVDNWMTHLRQKESARSYLVRLSSDVQGDIDNFASEVRWLAQRKRFADQILELVENEGEAPSDSVLAEAVNLVRAGPRSRDLLRATYLDLLNTGAFEYLGDEELRRAIIGYYEIFPGKLFSSVVEEHMQREVLPLSDGLNRHFDMRYVYGDSLSRNNYQLFVSSWGSFAADPEIRTYLRSVSARSSDITVGLTRFTLLATNLKTLVDDTIG